MRSSAAPALLQDLKRLRSVAGRIIEQIDSLKTRPERGHSLHGDLFPCHSLVVSYDGGGCRAVCLYDEPANACAVFAIGEHATIYDLARKRFPPEWPDLADGSR